MWTNLFGQSLRKVQQGGFGGRVVHDERVGQPRIDGAHVDNRAAAISLQMGYRSASGAHGGEEIDRQRGDPILV
jgi:hypothetical protein